MAFTRSAALLPTLALAGAACGTSRGAPTTSADTGDVVMIPNHGGDMEGHTPTGFAGSGTGLFAGDNLNATFPEGVGVQTFLTFAVPGGMTVGRAVLRSDALPSSDHRLMISGICWPSPSSTRCLALTYLI